MKHLLGAFLTGVVLMIAVPRASAQIQTQVLVEDVVIRGNRRLSPDSIRYYIQTRKGDPFNPAQIERDLQALWAQNLFRMIRVWAQDGPEGGKIVTFEVEENPIIRDLKFVGLKSAQESDVLQRFREKRVGVSKEAMWDPAKGQVARRVLREFLEEKGHPDSTIDIDVEELSTAAVAVTFRINEGPRVRVVKIEFEGNKIFSDKKLRKEMKFVREASFITRFTSRDIYNREALSKALERMRFFALMDNGYLDAQIGEPRVEMIEQGGGIPIPLLRKPRRGLKIVVPINEGRQYRFGKINVEGNSLFTDEQILKVIGLRTGDIVRSTVIQKGVYETLKDLYGANGYIQMVATPRHELQDDPNDPGKGIADFTIEVEEGRQFTLTRLDFTGNTLTRDKVLRREMLVSEGEVFNQFLWKQSLLRLNQLGFFEEIKDENATFRPNDRDGTLEIELNVKEKGRNQIQFTGGASGFGGSFIGIEYSTNNFFGYGESLSFSLAQGNRQRYFLFSFTEPYLLDRNVSVGFSIFARSLDFFGGGLGVVSGGFFGGFFPLGARGEELFKDRSAGFSIFASTPLATLTKRWWRLAQFSRVGLTYSYSSSSIQDPPVNRDTNPNNDIPVTFRQPDIRTSTLIPSFVYNTLNHPIDPTSGSSLSLSLGISGGFLGGNVKLVQPAIEYRFFRPAPLTFFGKPTVIGMRASFGHVSTYGRPFNSNSLAFVGGIPIFNRFFLGGEYDIRGYDFRGISPVFDVEQRFTSKNVAAVSSNEPDPLKTTNVLPVLDDAAPPTTRPFIRKSVLDKFVFTDELLTKTLIPVGGDTQLLYNFEWRIPLAGPLSAALFFDIGSTFNLRRYQDQLITAEPLEQFINPVFVAGRRVIPLGNTLLATLAAAQQVLINPNGFLATPEEVRIAQLSQGKTPSEVPDGFTPIFIRGLGQTKSNVLLSQGRSGLRGLQDYRASTGLEFRFQMPVINLPLRFIFAYNPNAKTEIGPNQIFFERRTAFRFGIGRTF